MKKLSLGFHASRSEEEAKKSKHPNTRHFIMEVIKQNKEYLIYIGTECGDGEKRFSSVEGVNEEVAKVRETFVKEGSWTITDHETIDIED